jgi:hypothetical protein
VSLSLLAGWNLIDFKPDPDPRSTFFHFIFIIFLLMDQDPQSHIFWIQNSAFNKAFGKWPDLNTKQDQSKFLAHGQRKNLDSGRIGSGSNFVAAPALSLLQSKPK